MNPKTLSFIICASCVLTMLICCWSLIHIHKTRYRNLWEKEKKKDSIWFHYERELYNQFKWKTPYWVKQEKDALIILWIFRVCSFLFLIGFIGSFYFSLERIN